MCALAYRHGEYTLYPLLSVKGSRRPARLPLMDTGPGGEWCGFALRSTQRHKHSQAHKRQTSRAVGFMRRVIGALAGASSTKLKRHIVGWYWILVRRVVVLREFFLNNVPELLLLTLISQQNWLTQLSECCNGSLTIKRRHYTLSACVKNSLFGNLQFHLVFFLLIKQVSDAWFNEDFCFEEVFSPFPWWTQFVNLFYAAWLSHDSVSWVCPIKILREPPLTSHHCDQTWSSDDHSFRLPFNVLVKQPIHAAVCDNVYYFYCLNMKITCTFCIMHAYYVSLIANEDNQSDAIYQNHIASR